MTIRNGYTTSHTGETHTFSKTGLTLSLSNRLVDTANNALGTLTRAHTVKDERLQALLAYKTYDDVKTSFNKSKWKDQAKSLHLNLSLGTERSEASTNVDTKIAKGSTVVSDGHIRVTTKKDDLRIEGSDVQGKDITLDSANSIYVKGKETTSKMTQSMKQKQAGLGISYDLLQHRFSDISVNASGSKGNIAGTDIVHNPTKIIATNTLGVTTKQDVHIKDGVLKGEDIQANIGGNLEIHSVQDTHDYTDHTTSSGMGLSLSKKGTFKSLQSSAQRTDIDSKYTSVIHQSGLYAGSTGFNLSVGNRTTLEGALLASQTDTNTLKTKQLVMKDMENRAKYTYGSKGLSYLADPSIGKGSKQYNELGLVPTLMPGEQGRANSTTYSAIAKGVLTVEEPEVNLNTIRRDTEDSLHTLATIFDKQGIAERQETAKLFSKYMNEAIHRFGEMRDAKGQRIYEDGSSEKVALHALSGAITSAIVKGNPTTGAISGGLNEALIQSISKLAKDHPARAQMLSASLGYTVDKLLGGHGLEGASIAQDGTKWNRYGPRRWFNGEVTVQLTEALQTKVANKEPIDLKDIKDIKFSILKDGKEEELWIEDLPDRYVVWVADKNGLGQDYLINKVEKRLVPIYGDFKTQYIGANNKKNIIYTGDDAILKNELNLYPTDEKSVPLGDIIRYKPVREFLGGFSEGFGDALKSDIKGQIEFLEELIFNPIGVVNDIQQLIKELRHFSNMQKYTEQLYKITNEIYDIAWGNDHKRKGVLLGQATEIVASIIFSPDKIKLSKVKFLNQVHKIMEYTPQRVKFEKAFETAVAMGKIVDEEKALINVNKINAIENKVEATGKEADVIAKETAATKKIKINEKESPKKTTTETASPTTNTTNLADSPDIYRNGEQYKPGVGTRQLKENIIYESKGYYYQTDELGRIKVAQGDLRLEAGKRNNRDQLKAGYEDRLRGDHGGHLIARIFGGSGELDNLVAMDKIVNTIEYRDVEKLWENALKDGKAVNINITLDYAEANKRPTGFNVKYEIGEFKDEIYLSNGG
ncbi:DNA/RNA non-specific endonuclease [Veillonella sp. CHU740]|uniref:DNA/RNA non-specific endonuclease n=1 Tax=Veillonella sp. CHU740 TaxID=2490950 RepID=UPI000F8EC413|nr:DNA/RNA non-specific endonuclease [Veillonella sp. CHU740]